MALQQWSPHNRFQLRPGYVLFSTSVPSYHAMIVRENSHATATAGLAIPVYHISPPLGEPQSLDGHHTPDEQTYLGFLDVLDEEDCRQIVEAVRQLGRNLSSVRLSYGLDTHSTVFNDPNRRGRQRTKMRFSCASFVESCYEHIGADLVDEKSVVPIGDAAVWEAFYSADTYSAESAAALTRKVGLRQPGPWPVLLPASQMRAFAQLRTDCAHAYRATHGDHPYA